MTRRAFLSSLATATAIRAHARPAARITRITLAPIRGRFHTLVAMNSYDVAPNRHTYTNTLTRIATDAYHAALRMLIGADSSSLFTMRDGVVADRAPGG